MAQLDRFLNLLVTNNGSGLVLAEGDVAKVTIKDSARPVMKQPLTSAQILTLVREIAPGTPKARPGFGCEVPVLCDRACDRASPPWSMPEP